MFKHMLYGVVVISTGYLSGMNVQEPPREGQPKSVMNANEFVMRCFENGRTFKNVCFTCKRGGCLGPLPGRTLNCKQLPIYENDPVMDNYFGSAHE